MVRRVLHLVAIALLAMFLVPHGPGIARTATDRHEIRKHTHEPEQGVQQASRPVPVAAKPGFPFPLAVPPDWSWRSAGRVSRITKLERPTDRLVDHRQSIRRFRLRGHAPPGSADAWRG